jgi:hypothetical protein
MKQLFPQLFQLPNTLWSTTLQLTAAFLHALPILVSTLELLSQLYPLVLPAPQASSTTLLPANANAKPDSTP